MKLKVLLVDDKIPFLDTAIRYLNKNANIGLVGWALSGSEALQKIEIFRPDLVLIDLSLPDANGLQIIREIKKINNNQKIIVLTLLDDFEYRSEAKSAGADDFIFKSDFVSKFPALIQEMFFKNL